MKAEIKILEPKNLWPNQGQIAGLPSNPRNISDKSFKKLVQSIKDHPEMLNLRELLVYPDDVEGQYIIIAGNMRFRACMEAGVKKIPCKILPKNTPVEALRAYTIKDNVAFGENDWDLLANEWDEHELADWGMEIPPLKASPDDEEPEEKTYIPTFKFEVECNTEGERNKLMAELLDRGFSCTDDY